MLENNEPIKGVDLSTVFQHMVEELPWMNLRGFIQANAQLQKRCTQGGQRLVPKKRKRIESILVKEAARCDFNQAYCSGFFAAWYPVHEHLHKMLEDYFHSDEYKTYRKDNDLSDDTYVLTDEKFDEFFKVDNLEWWRVILCFSPLQFTKDQYNRMINDNNGNVGLLKRVRELEAQVAEVTKERDSLANTKQSLAKQADEAGDNVQELKKTIRELREENSVQQTNLKRLQGVEEKLTAELTEKSKSVKELEGSVNEQVAAAKQDFNRDLSRLEEEKNDWQAKYEQLKTQNNDFEEKVYKAERNVKDIVKEKDDVQERVAQLENFADLILSKIDWLKVGKEIKPTPTIKRQFNSLVKKLRYDEQGVLKIEDVLTKFWSSLADRELELIKAVAESNVNEVASGDINNYWQGLTDFFEDVRISLEARLVLLKLLHEIFYETMDVVSLEEDKISF